VTTALPGVLLSAVSTVITNDLQSVLAAVQNAISALTFGLIPPAASTPAAASVAAARVTAAPALALATPAASARASAVASPRPVAARHAAAAAVSTAPVDTAPTDTLDRADATAPVADAAPVAPKSGSRSRAGVRHTGKAASDAAPAASRRSSPRTG